MDRQSRERIAAFMFLQIFGGQVLMPLIIITASISKRVVRHPIFLNFCTTLVLYSFSYTLLLYAGQVNNPTPPVALCLIQAGMVGGAPPMVALSVFMFTLHLNLSIREVSNQRAPYTAVKIRTIAMFAAPYILYLIVFTSVVVYGGQHLDQVVKYPYYCTLKNSVSTDIREIIGAVCLLAAIVFQVWTTWLVRQSRVYQSKTISITSLSVLVRAALLIICNAMGLATSIIFITDQAGPVTNMTLALHPLLAFFIFGTQKDLWDVWRFWKKPTQQPQSARERYVTMRDSNFSASSLAHLKYSHPESPVNSPLQLPSPPSPPSPARYPWV
ncbi:hypothetical protein M422DRAFT_784916 [Sphaerobolus stellatus SS14]|uniref:Unplaced genomic scaffold SPHSTscaffold_262, whole genome shotgun sequence n=1 Tax=Sphaerobolus stellatus (strain SS14) TaxID=990650 RepID=A0A0C9UPT5_SPHS4|nr:hypothetical protein M422DRAFT_784916 [Sphaerobolus stellatus SS14]